MVVRERGGEDFGIVVGEDVVDCWVVEGLFVRRMGGGGEQGEEWREGRLGGL